MKQRLLISILVALALPGASRAAEPMPPAELATRLDELIAERTGADLQPGDEATLHRRLTLDLVGRIPTVAETRAYLADSDPHKRDDLIVDLLQSSGHSRHAGRIWRRIWIPRSETAAYRSRAVAFDEWLAHRLRDDVGADEIVRTLVTATPAPALGRSEADEDRSTPALFLAASEYEPEQLAANSARAFLGLNLDCAQCHNHPFARWTQDEFWQTAAFFARPPADFEAYSPQTFRLRVADTDRETSPRFLDGNQPAWPELIDRASGRRLIAEWIVSPENPYFARNLVNRAWGQFFSAGLIEPFDDLSGEVAPEHPEVLDELTRNFVASHFDLRYLVESIVRTKLYQSSTATADVGDPQSSGRRSALRLTVRNLSAEQLYDSLHVAAGHPVDRFDLESLRPQWNDREAFIRQFQRGEAIPADRSAAQSLTLMNGQLAETLTDEERSPLLVGLQAPFLTDERRLEILYLATLNRYPDEEERASGLADVAEGGESAWSDAFWALLNSHEFNTNH